MEDPTSATQNMNLLLNAFDLDETTTQVVKLDNELNADGDCSKHDDGDNENPISAMIQVKTQRIGKKLTYFLDSLY